MERVMWKRSGIEKAIWASKLALLVMGAVSSATLFRVAVIPHILDLALSTLPGAFSSFKSNFSSPLYLYIAVNFVIAAIVVSSSFTHKNDTPKNDNSKSHIPDQTHNHSAPSLDKKNSWESFHIVDDVDSTAEIIHHVIDEVGVSEARGEDEEEEESSLDDTWQKIITAKELRRSETFAAATTTEKDDVNEDTSAKEMRKSETFTERVSFRRRDKSISHEELGRRADEFIRKVNADMRLQRLESDQRFRDMVNRGL